MPYQMQNKNFYREVLLNSPIAFALHRIILDRRGDPEDYEFVEVNDAFALILGLKREEVEGKRVKEVLPGIQHDSFDWISAYGDVSLQGTTREFEQYSEKLKKRFKVQAYSPEKYYFITTFTDITQELQQSEDLNNFFSVNLDLFCITDNQGRFIRMNRAWEAVLGFPVNELVGHEIMELVHPDDRDATLGKLASLAGAKEVRDFVNRIATVNGLYRFIEWRCIPAGDRTYAAARDVTERLQEKEFLERMVAESHVLIQSTAVEPDYQKLTNLIKDISGAAYAVFNLFEENGREFTTRAISGISGHIEKAARLMGFDIMNHRWAYDPVREEKIKKHSLTTFPEIHQLTGSVLSMPMIKLLERMFGLGEVVVARIEKDHIQSGDFTLIFKTGETLRNKELVQLFCTQLGLYLDRRRGSNALRRSRIELNSLFDDAPVGYHEFDSTGKITRINNTELRLLGYEKHELIGSPVWMLSADPETGRQNVLGKLAGTKVDKGAYERVMRRKDGSLVTMLLEDMFLHDSNGNIGGVRTSLMDISGRKKLEEELKTSEEKFRLIVSHSSDLIWNIDSRLDFTYSSPSWKRITGYQTEWLTGRHYLTLIHPMDAQACEAFFRHTLIEQKVLPSLEYRVRHADGDWHWHSTTCTPVSGTSGGNTYLVGVSRDVTHRRIVEEKLRSSEQNFRNLFETLADSLVITDTQGKILYTNDTFRKTFGYTEKQLAAMQFTDLHPEDKRAEAQLLMREVREGRRQDCPLPLVTSTRKTIPVETRVWFGKWNEQECMFAISKNLTKEQEALQKFNRLFENNPALMAVITCDEKIFTEVNSAFFEKTGYTREEILGRTVTELDLLPFSSEMEDVAREIRTSGRIQNHEIKLKTKSGESLDGLFSLEVIESQGIKYFLTVMTDITTQKKAENDLLKANQELEKAIAKAQILAEKANSASNAKSEFLASMSHEIRTPLNGVIGFIDLILNSDLHPVQRQFIENAHVSARMLLDLINDILDFSKIEAGKLDLNEEKTDVVALLEQASDIVSVGAARKGVEILLDIDPEAPRFIRVDPVRLKQIVVNLLGNAVKFTEAGEVELRLTMIQNPMEDVPGTFEFSVRDTGIGITPEQMNRLFNAFVQAEESTARKYGGTGLGLVISNKLLQMMGSELSLESEPGRGSRFYFRISREAEWTRPKQSSLTANLSKILLVENNLRNAGIIRRLLEFWQLDVTTAGSPEEASGFIHGAYRPDLILLDETLPRAASLDWLRTEKNLPETKQIPVILMQVSGEGAEKLEEFRECGVRTFVVKPLKMSELFDAIESAVLPESSQSRAYAWEVPDDISRAPNEQPLILIAEDVPLNRVLLGEMIKSFLPGVRLLEAANGREAVEQYKEHQPDLVLMDVQMPVFDGCDATIHIRQHEEMTGIHVPIVAVTASALSSERVRCLSAGMDEFITKPIDRMALRTLLSNLFPGSIGTVELQAASGLSSELKNFNEAALIEMIGNSIELLTNLKTQSITQFPQYLEELHTVIASRDAALLKKAAHKLKGAARNMCFEKIADFALEIEEFEEPDFGIVEFLFSEIMESWERVRAELYQKVN